ncbi:MAG: ATP-binding cassette domain-containing protein [Bacteroidia bacterium]|nr:ATP-binding cassette domain-containing protein [Bacteroidia bacterium]
MESTILSLSNANIYQRSNMILTGVNLEIGKSEFVYLIGKTGSGKSSLLRTLYADLPLREGQGMVAGYSLNGLKDKDVPFLRRKLGIVFQDFQLLTDRNVYENLNFVLRATGWTDKSKIDQQIRVVLDNVGLGSLGQKMPHQLSGGEQQRVSIARALLNNPELILADEPTGNLDPETSEGILNLLVSISQFGCAVLMATHNYNFFKQHPSRTVKCENGRVIEYNQETAKNAIKEEDFNDPLPYNVRIRETEFE